METKDIENKVKELGEKFDIQVKIGSNERAKKYSSTLTKYSELLGIAYSNPEKRKIFIEEFETIDPRDLLEIMVEEFSTAPEEEKRRVSMELRNFGADVITLFANEYNLEGEEITSKIVDEKNWIVFHDAAVKMLR